MSTHNPAAAFYASPAARGVAALLRGLHRVSPGLGTRVALGLFFTPMPTKWLARSRPVALPWRETRLPFEGGHVSVWQRSGLEAGRPKVLLTHGWAGDAQQMRPLADTLAQAGFEPVLLDLPAHGRSAGRTSNLPQFARALEYSAARLHAQGLDLQAVVAHSLGANAAAYAASRGLALQRLVLLAPPASPYEYTRLFARLFGLSERTRGAMQQRIEAREAILMPQFEPPAVGPRIGVPTLVLHDRGDRINAHADGQAYAHAIAGAQLISTEGLGHMKLLQDAAVLAEVTRFVTRPLRPS